MTKWCCASFEANFGDSGKRGICIVVRKSEVGVMHELLCRSVDAGQEQLVASKTPLSLDSRIRYTVLSVVWNTAG